MSKLHGVPTDDGTMEIHKKSCRTRPTCWKRAGRKIKKKGTAHVPEISFSVLNTFHTSSKDNGNKGITLYVLKIKKLISTQKGSVITQPHHLLTVKQVKAYSYLLVHEINITFKTETNGKLLWKAAWTNYPRFQTTRQISW